MTKLLHATIHQTKMGIFELRVLQGGNDKGIGALQREEIGMTDERSPSEGRVELDVGLELPLQARRPHEHHYDPGASLLGPPAEPPPLPPHLRPNLRPRELRFPPLVLQPRRHPVSDPTLNPSLSSPPSQLGLSS